MTDVSNETLDDLARRATVRDVVMQVDGETVAALVAEVRRCREAQRQIDAIGEAVQRRGCFLPTWATDDR